MCLVVVEGVKYDAYNDGGGVMTAGVGHVLKGDELNRTTFTEAEVVAWLKEDVKDSEDTVNDFVGVELNQHEFDALVSFVFNVGRTAFRTSTLLKRLNKGLYTQVRHQMMRWVYDNGVYVKGLENRRVYDLDVFYNGEYLSRG